MKIIDLRQKSEFNKGNISGSISFPLFNDGEKEQLQSGKNVKRIIHDIAFERVKKSDFFNREGIVVYCKTGKVESLVLKHWFPDWKINILQGGYNGYRKKVKFLLNTPVRFIRLWGKTGAGKTEVLNQLNRNGLPTINIEELLDNPGSAFGSITQKRKEEISQEQFENQLFESIKNLPKPIFIETKSRNIGKNKLPKVIYESLMSAPIIEIKAQLELRIERIKNTYCNNTDHLLEQGLQKIKSRMSGDIYKKAQKRLNSGNHDEFIKVLLKYYDNTEIYKNPGKKPILKTNILDENYINKIQQVWQAQK